MFSPLSSGRETLSGPRTNCNEYQPRSETTLRRDRLHVTSFLSSMDLQTHVLLGFHWELELFLRPIESRAEAQYQRGQKVSLNE